MMWAFMAWKSFANTQRESRLTCSSESLLVNPCFRSSCRIEFSSVFSVHNHSPVSAPNIVIFENFEWTRRFSIAVAMGGTPSAPRPGVSHCVSGDRRILSGSLLGCSKAHPQCIFGCSGHGKFVVIMGQDSLELCQSYAEHRRQNFTPGNIAVSASANCWSLSRDRVFDGSFDIISHQKRDDAHNLGRKGASPAAGSFVPSVAFSSSAARWPNHSWVIDYLVRTVLSDKRNCRIDIIWFIAHAGHKRGLKTKQIRSKVASNRGVPTSNVIDQLYLLIKRRGRPIFLQRIKVRAPSPMLMLRAYQDALAV